MPSSALKHGDVLFAIVGATIGKVGVFREKIEANINQAICGVRLKPEILPEYLQAFFMSNLGQMFIEQAKRPVARANLNLDEIGKLPIYFPEIEVQQQVVSKVNEIYKLNKEKRIEAKLILANAKAKVEKMILEGALE